MVKVPDDLTDPIALADWLELHALMSNDSNSSRGDLDSLLRKESVDVISEDEIEVRLAETFSEVEERANSAVSSYPFELNLNSGVLTLRSDWREYPAYFFCLTLSYFGPNESPDAPKLFERISCHALKNYVSGDAIGFGFPRQDLPGPFLEALQRLCELIGDGTLLGQEFNPDAKDDKLDVVGWKYFPDGRNSKLIAFGQCAAGKNWQDKVGELDPATFCKAWVTFVSPLPIKCFFVPHRIENEKWSFMALKSGVLFDRCRIAFWAQSNMDNFSDLINWLEQKIQTIRS